MKVLHICVGNMFGGVETLLVTMARERRLCLEMKPHFSVCFENRLSRELRASGAPVDYLGNVQARNPFTAMRARAALDRLLPQEAIDVAICHAPWSHAIFAPVVKRHGIPLVFWCHGFLTGRHWLEIWAGLTPPALVIANSHASAQKVKLTFPHAPIQVLYCPVVMTGKPRLHDSESKSVVIIQVSRMEKLKGQLLTLGALAQLQDLPDWVCWFVGGAHTDKDRDYEESLHRAAEGLGLKDRVVFHGERTDVVDLLGQADIFCQPNISPDAFGIAFIEALQSSLPVVSTRMGGAVEIINESCGVLVSPEPIELANALRKLMLDPGARRRLGAAGPARAEALCDPARQLGQLREILQALF